MCRFISPLLLALLLFPESLLAQQPPVVLLTAPTNNPIFFSLSDPLVVHAEASDPDGFVSAVRLLRDGTSIAADFQPPYEFIFTPQNYGEFNFQVEAVDGSGATTRSDSRRVQYVRVYDNLELGIPLSSGTNVILRSSNVSATHQKGEPQHAGVPGGKSVWFAWRSQFTGTVVIDTMRSDFDTVLAVYTNRLIQFASVSNLVLIAANDNDSKLAPLSRVKFTTIPNATYYIAVDGRDGFAGNIELAIRQTRSLAPTNDFLAFATRTFSTTVNISNVGASKELGEPAHAGNSGGASMWWRIDLPVGPSVRISTAGSTFDTLLAVYTNLASRAEPLRVPTMEELRPVAANDDAAGTNRTSEVIFNPTTFGSYWIAVDGYNGAEGTIRLAISVQGIPFSPPRNDHFANAAVLGGSSAVEFANTTYATGERSEPIPPSGRAGGRSVWYRWNAPADGPVYVSTEWSSFDTLLSVYTGTTITGLTSVAWNDDAEGLRTSALVFQALKDVEYRIWVAGFSGASGEMVLTLNQPKAILPRMITQYVQGKLAISVTQTMEPVLLESSADLVSWQPVRWLSSGEDPLQIEPSLATPRQFYRVRGTD